MEYDIPDPFLTFHKLPPLLQPDYQESPDSVIEITDLDFDTDEGVFTLSIMIK